MSEQAHEPTGGSDQDDVEPVHVDGPKGLLVEYILSPDVASPDTEVDPVDLGIDIEGLTISPSGPVAVVASRHGPLIMIRGTADDIATVSADPRVVGVWLDRSDDDAQAGRPGESEGDLRPEWDDPDVEGPERYLF